MVRGRNAKYDSSKSNQSQSRIKPRELNSPSPPPIRTRSGCNRTRAKSAPRLACIRHAISRASAIARPITTFATTVVAARAYGLSRSESRGMWRIARHRVIVIAMRHEVRSSARAAARVHGVLSAAVDGNKSDTSEMHRTRHRLPMTSARSIRFAWWCMKRIRRTREGHPFGRGDAQRASRAM